MNLKFSASVVFCNSLEEQVTFYKDFLKQEIEMDFGACVIFKNGFSLWKLSDEYPISKELGYKYEPIGNRNLELCFETDEFEQAVEEVLISDIRMLHNVTEEKWGQYTIRFYDPEGNLIEIGESLYCMCKRMDEAGRNVEEISEKSGLSVTHVKSLLK